MTNNRKKNDKIVNKSFNLIHWNCNSLNNKIEEFKSFCFKFNPEIISLNETKMSEFNAKYILNINNYTTIHRSRNNDKNGAGGVALLIRNDIKFSESSLLESLNQELIAINTINNGKETCIIAYYNPPNLKIDEKIFDILKNESTEYIIMGDLNAKSTLWGADKNNENGDILDNIMIENDCIIVNNKDYTHENFNGKTASILDYCIISTKLYDIFEDFIVLKDEDMTSDHLPFQLKLKLFKTNLFNKNREHLSKTKTYNYKKADWEKFKSTLPTVVDEKIGYNVDLLEKFVRDSLISAADNSIPIFKNKANKYKQPSLIRWDIENPINDWSFTFKFNEPILNSSEKAGIYLHYTKEKPTIGEFKGGNGLFHGFIAGIEFTGKSVDLVYIKNNGEDYTSLEEFVTQTDSINPIRIKSIETITMKIISTSKNLKIELYNEDKLIYDNFKIFSVSDLGFNLSGKYLGITADYKNVSSGKAFKLKEAQLYKRIEKADYNIYKSYMSEAKPIIREKEEIHHYDTDVQELIHKIELSNSYIKAILGDLPETTINKAEEGLIKDIKMIEEKVKKLEDSTKSKSKNFDLSHRLNEMEIKIKQLHRSIKDMDYIVDKFIKYKVKSNSSIDYIILISSCIILTAWATYECLHLKNQKQSN
jgi:hypothetical protein